MRSVRLEGSIRAPSSICKGSIRRLSGPEFDIGSAYRVLSLGAFTQRKHTVDIA